MAGDYSRKSFDARRDFAAVLMQQGHPTLDADWNEFVAIVDRRFRTETVDIIGRAVVPRETPLGFQVAAAAGPQLTIGRGRMYVDGLLAENHGAATAANPPVLDRARLNAAGLAEGVLDELISQAAGDVIDYAQQPYLPVPPPLPATAGPHVVYLDVWQREVTPLKDPRLLEPALNGIDTATRLQTIWQVRVLPDVGTGTTCATDLAAWDALVAPSAARLTTATIEFEDPDEPCLLPPGGGYRGLENQLYRVELHLGGPRAQSRFKWSRDNASVGATVEAFAANDRLQVRRIGRDSVLRFRTGDWVEITDDRRELAGLAGDLRRVEVDEDANELRLDSPLSADLIPAGGADTAASRHSRVTRWDQNGEVRLANGDLLVDLDAPGSGGLIPLPPAGEAVVLEAGVTVAFDFEPGGGAARAMDHWCFAARTAGAQVEILDRAPPAGIHHHYARLALVTFPGAVQDCRIFWPPEFGDGDDCSCTLCVSAEAHNSGAFTIQQAIAQLPEAGGTICLGPGTYLLGDDRVLIQERENIRIRGHGPATVLAYAGVGGAIQVLESDQVFVSDLGVFVSAPEIGGGGLRAAFHLTNTEQVTIARTVLFSTTSEGSRGFGVALDGTHAGLEISDSLIVASIGVGALADPEREEGLRYCGLNETLIEGNVFFGRTGVDLRERVVHLGVTRIVLNAIASFDAGIAVTGAGDITDTDGPNRADAWSHGGVVIVENTILTGASASGVISGVPYLHLADNEIVGFQENPDAPSTACCIRLVEGFVPRQRPDTHIVGNRMGRVRGFGLSIESDQRTLLVKQNLIRDCRAGGVQTLPEARIGSLAFDNNFVERVGDGAPDRRAVGVSLSSVIDGKVIGNTISEVGSNLQDASSAGLAIRGAMALDISHNTIADIGPATNGGELFGIVLRGPILTADISSNRVLGVGVSTEGDGSSWAAIALDGRAGEDFRRVAGAPAGSTATDPLTGAALNTYPAFVNAGGRTMSVSRLRVTDLGGVREPQVRISGNLAIDARPRSQLPLVIVLLGEDSQLSFAENQCRRLAEAGDTPVTLQAQRLVVANNQVRWNNDAPAMRLTAGVFGRNPTATVTGNITFGQIELNNQALNAPWAPLNILG